MEDERLRKCVILGGSAIAVARPGPWEEVGAPVGSSRMWNHQKGSVVTGERGSREKIWSSCILVEQRQQSQRRWNPRRRYRERGQQTAARLTWITRAMGDCGHGLRRQTTQVGKGNVVDTVEHCGKSSAGTLDSDMAA